MTVQFTNKLNKADLDEVRKLTHPDKYLTFCLQIGIVLPLLWRAISRYLHGTSSKWESISIVCAFAVISLLVRYGLRRARALELAQLNATRPDQISLSHEGVKYDGPNGVTLFLPWKRFKGWSEGRRVVLVERSEGNWYVVLPVAQLAENERIPIRQLLQENIQTESLST